ncbi:hypothetical protein LAD77_01450 [Klebsiella pneumoniae]|nr:hypothetical protein [Klebsiella pneumoniae]
MTGRFVAEGVVKVLRGGAQFSAVRRQSASSAMSRKRSLEECALARGRWSWPGFAERDNGYLSARWPHWKKRLENRWRAK